MSEQCAKLAEVFGCHHLAVGKLMRAEVMSESEEGRAIAAMLHEGKPIPATAYASLFRRAVASVPLEPAAEGTPAATFLLDGFPRSTENARLLEGELGAPTAVLVLSAPDDVARARALRADGAALDDEGALDKRLASYRKRTAPMVEALQRGSAPVHRVDASGAESHVSAAVVHALGWALPAGLALPLAPGDAAAEAAAATVGEPAATAVESAAVADAAIPPAAAPEDAAAQSDPRRRIVLVLGAPGSGKRTQCALLAERCGYAHLSPSRLLAEAAESGSAEGARIGAQMRLGKILPAQVSIDLLRSAMGSRAGPYVVDGFPRSLDSARVLEAQVGARARAAAAPHKSALLMSSPARAPRAPSPTLLFRARSWAPRRACSCSRRPRRRSRRACSTEEPIRRTAPGRRSPGGTRPSAKRPRRWWSTSARVVGCTPSRRTPPPRRSSGKSARPSATSRRRPLPREGWRLPKRSHNRA